MRINYNESAILAGNALNKTDGFLSDSIERLSSGLKINHAKDNPAGLAIANRMDSQVRGLGVASDNTNDGISVVSIADGALSEISAILQRLNQLANQAGHDVKTDDDRQMLNEEVMQLKDEISRIARDTEFNGQPLLDGTFDLRGYTDTRGVKVETYTDSVPVGHYTVNLQTLKNEDAAGLKAMKGFENLVDLNIKYDQEEKVATIKAAGDFEMVVSFENESFTNDIDLDITGIGAMKIQIGANEGQELGIRVPKISLKTMGLETLDVSTFEDAQRGIEQVKGALAYISSARSRLGAYQNRMEHNSSSLGISEENMTASYSRIMDIDMAKETTNFATQQVLVQAGTSMLAQANQRPEQILQLLQ